jgi:hypothetical protein
MLQNMFDDPGHRELATAMLHAASEPNGIAVDSVDFGERDREAPSSWLCYLADPAADNRVAALTQTSALDYLKRYDPNGFLGNLWDAGDRADRERASPARRRGRLEPESLRR